RGPRRVPLRRRQPQRLTPRHRGHHERARQRGRPDAAPGARDRTGIRPQHRRAAVLHLRDHRHPRHGVRAAEATDSVEPLVEMWTDGACKGNPGPGGWGALIRWDGVEKERRGGEAATTNNRMELTAVIEGLRALKRPCAVRLHVDSSY